MRLEREDDGEGGVTLEGGGGATLDELGKGR